MLYRIRQTEELDVVQELDRVCFAGEKVIQGPYLDDGHWWLATDQEGTPVAYAGLYQKEGEDKAFLCRAGVLPEARGHGLQVRLVRVRLAMARRLGVPRVYTYVSSAGIASMKTLVRCGLQPYHYMYDEVANGGFVYFEKKWAPGLAGLPPLQPGGSDASATLPEVLGGVSERGHLR